MKRHFNYTDRKRVPRESVQIVLKDHANGPPTFEATVDLKEIKLPDTGRVFIEQDYRVDCLQRQCDFGAFTLRSHWPRRTFKPPHAGIG